MSNFKYYFKSISDNFSHQYYLFLFFKEHIYLHYFIAYVFLYVCLPNIVSLNSHHYNSTTWKCFEIF